MEVKVMKKILVRRLGVASVAKLIGVIQALWGFIAGFIAMFGGIAAVAEQDDWNLFAKIFADIAVVVFSLLVIPLIAFVIGWLYGAVFALIANLFLQTANGLELDVEEEK